MTMKRALSFGIFMIIAWALISIAIYLDTTSRLTVYHENAHVQINNMFDCPSKVHYDFMNLGGYTNFTCPRIDVANQLELRTLHEENEIITYNISALVFPISVAVSSLFIIAMCLIIFLASILLSDDYDKKSQGGTQK